MDDRLDVDGQLVQLRAARLAGLSMIVWTAFVLSCFSFGLIVGAVLFAVRAWRQMRTTIVPLISMFAPPAVGAKPAGGADSGRVVAPSAVDDVGGVIHRDPYKFTHTVTHAPECAIFDERPCDCANTPQ